MARWQRRFVAFFFATTLLVLFPFHFSAEAADGPNRGTPSDVAAGRWIDALLDPNLTAASQGRGNRLRPRRTTAQRQRGLHGKLVRNPNVGDGLPSFALVDRDGGILRYVEPVDSIPLKKYLGQAVAVRHDTGDILLASQLALPRTGQASVKTGLQLAQHLEPIPAGKPVADDIPDLAGEVVDGPIAREGPTNGPVYLEGDYYEGEYGDGGYVGGYDEGLNFGGCPDCGSYVCRQFGGCGPGSRGKAYVRGEYLSWWFDGMDTPALVTQSDPIDGGVLPNPGIPGDNPSTVILFGGEDVLDDPRSGGRLLFGVWLDEEGRQGLEFDYLGFDTETLTFSAAGTDGNPTISRPFFDLFPDDNGDGVIDSSPAEAAQQVSSATLDGRVTVRIESDYESFGIRFRHNLCCCESCSVGCGGGVGCGSRVGSGGGTRRVDLLTGFRYARLDEGLGIREDLTVDAGDAGQLPPGLVIPPDGTQFIVNDLFKTENEFIGAEIGFLWEIERQRLTLELLSKMAIGSTRQRALVAGSTAVIANPATVPAPDPSVGGLLAQSSNIGGYERDEFSVIPEVGFTLGYRFTPRLKLTAGYTLLYWTNVLRPGDQIDRGVNGTLIPSFDADGAPVPPGPLAGPLRPAFEFENTNLWAQGISLGGEYRW